MTTTCWGPTVSQKTSHAVSERSVLTSLVREVSGNGETVWSWDSQPSHRAPPAPTPQPLKTGNSSPDLQSPSSTQPSERTVPSIGTPGSGPQAAHVCSLGSEPLVSQTPPDSPLPPTAAAAQQHVVTGWRKLQEPPGKRAQGSSWRPHLVVLVGWLGRGGAEVQQVGGGPGQQHAPPDQRVGLSVGKVPGHLLCTRTRGQSGVAEKRRPFLGVGGL